MFVTFLISFPLLGALKLQIVEGRPLLDGVFVNGHGPYRFLIDTGTTMNHIDPKIAKSIGLRPTYRTELVTSAGAVYVPGAGKVAVSIEGVRAENQSFLFAGMDAVHQAYSNVQGVLGQEFLSRFDFLLDMKAKEIDFAPTKPLNDGTHADFQKITGRAVVPTSLGPLVLDSGASKVTLFNVESHSPLQEMLTMSGSVSVGTAIRRLAIGSRTFWHGEAITIPGSAESGPVGLMPVSVFKSVYVSNSSGYVVLK